MRALIICLLLLLPLGAVADIGPKAEPDDELVVEESLETLSETVRPQPPKLNHALTFWCSPYPLEQGWAVRVTHRWNQLHPDQAVRLVAIPQDRLAEDVFREAIQEGDTPDLTNHLFPSNTSEFVQSGALVDLTAYPSLLKHLGERSGQEAGEPFFSRDGALYQFPWKGNPILLQYNAGLFRRYGVEPPRTYSQMLEAAKILKGQSEEPIWLWAPAPSDKFWRRYYDFFTLYIAASGGQGLLTEDGRPAFDNATGVAVMRFLQQLYSQGASPRSELYPDAPSELDGFSKDNLATMMTGPWNIELVRDVAGEEIQFDFVGVPVPDGYPVKKPVYSYGNFRNFGVFQSCKRPDLAAEFVEFATSLDNDLLFLETTHQLPFRQKLTQDARFVAALQKGPAHLAKFALQSKWLRPVDNEPYFNEVMAAISAEFVACAVKNEKTAEQAVKDAALKADKLRQKHYEGL